MTERLNMEQIALISEREVLEHMGPMELRQFKADVLSKMSELEAYVNMINDVLDGNGADPGAAYDAADDGTRFSPEYPDDSRWAIRSNN